MKLCILLIAATGWATSLHAGRSFPAAVPSPLALIENAPRPVGASLTMLPDAFLRLRECPSLTLSDFPLDAVRGVTLELRSFQVTGPGATLLVGTDAGDVPVPYPEVLLFEGRVDGQPESWAFLGVSPDRVNAIIHLHDEEEYIVAPLPERIAAGAADTHVIYERFSAGTASPPSDFTCRPLRRDGTPATERPSSRVPALETSEGGGPGEGGPRGGLRVAWLAVDCDWEFRNLPPFASFSDALAYAIQVLGVVHVIYERDVQTRMYVNFLRVWDTLNDPYDAADTDEQLPEFENFMVSEIPGVSREVNHLFSGRSLGGGLAFLDVLCDAYGISANMQGAFPPPPQDGVAGNWDILVVPHEIGHNFGSPHTHCYDPPIDTCAGANWDCPNPQVCQQSELMSYCHLCPGGTANIRLRFEHPAVLAEMREDVSCLRPVISPCFVDVSNVGFEDGQPLTPYNQVFKGYFGVLPGGTIAIAPGDYPEAMRLERATRLERWGNSGMVTIGN